MSATLAVLKHSLFAVLGVFPVLKAHLSNGTQ